MNVNSGPHLAGGNVGSSAGEIEASPPPVLPVARPLDPPIVARQVQPIVIGAVGAGGGVRTTEGGSPLFVDRAILVVLIALLAFIVNRVA